MNVFLKIVMFFFCLFINAIVSCTNLATKKVSIVFESVYAELRPKGSMGFFVLIYDCLFISHLLRACEALLIGCHALRSCAYFRSFCLYDDLLVFKMYYFTIDHLNQICFSKKA